MKRARHDIEAQGALHPKRLGRFTASSAAKLFMKPATTGYKDAIASVAYERFTGVQPEGSFQGNFWTERGHELEAWAYRWQLAMQMLVCDRDWVDFQSYDEHLPAFRIRAHRDEKVESDLLEQLWIAVEQAEGLIDKLKRGK